MIRKNLIWQQNDCRMNVGNLISDKREINLPFNALRSKGDFSRELFISTELFDKVGGTKWCWYRVLHRLLILFCIWYFVLTLKVCWKTTHYSTIWKKKSDLPNSSIFKNCVFFGSFFCIIYMKLKLKLLVGFYVTQLLWISLAEMEQQFSVNAIYLYDKIWDLQFFFGFCKILKICPGAQKWVGAHTSLGPNELGRWDPNVS